MPSFYEKFNAETNGQFKDALRLSDVTYNPETHKALVRYTVNYFRYNELLKKKTTIENATKAVFPPNVEIAVEFVRTYIDNDKASAELKKWFAENFPILYVSFLGFSLLSYDKDMNIMYIVMDFDITAEKLIADVGFQKKAKEVMSQKFACSFDISFTYKRCESDVSASESLIADVITYRKIERYIKVTNLVTLVGKDLCENAVKLGEDVGAEGVAMALTAAEGSELQVIYIEDLLPNLKEICICGTVTRITSIQTKTGKTLFVIRLADFTGEYTVKYFAIDKNAAMMQHIETDTAIAVKGKTVKDTFDNTTVFMANAISLCKLPENFKRELPPPPIPAPHYVTVAPRPIKIDAQASMFHTPGDISSVPEYIKNKNIVVFDIETTGLNVMEDRITEIGAVRIKDGVIAECFSTLVNPYKTIPPEVVEKTGITNEMVVDSPSWDKVAPDFYKFCYGAVLAGHNIDNFDVPFIKNQCKALKLPFDHETIDTLTLARKYFAGKVVNYKLETLLDYYSIEVDAHHRALDDCVGNARLLLRMSELF